MTNYEDDIEQFDKLKAKMETFTRTVQTDLNSKVHEAMTIMQHYRSEIDQLQVEQDILTTKLKKLDTDEVNIENEIQTFKTGNDEAKNKFQMYQIKKNQLTLKRKELLKESSEIDKLIQEKEIKVKEQREKLQLQRQRDHPEVKLYETLLGMTIDGSQPGMLSFIFNSFDNEDMDKSCSLNLDVSSEKFKILNTTPELNPNTEIIELESILNVNNNLPSFIVRSREALIRKATT